MVTYKVELANKLRKGRAVGNLWGVGRYVNGCQTYWVLRPQDSEDLARTFKAALECKEIAPSESKYPLVWDTFVTHAEQNSDGCRCELCVSVRKQVGAPLPAGNAE